MFFEYDWSGGKIPWTRDCPIFDADNLDEGEMLMLGTTDPDTGTDEGCCLVTAFHATMATQAVDSVGILAENTFATGGTDPDLDFSPTTANIAYQCQYGKVVYNPWVIYKAEYLQGTSYDDAITSTSGTTLTIPSAADDVNTGGWVYFPLDTTTTVKFLLRFITACASGSMTMDSACLGNGDTDDTHIFIERPNNYIADLSDTAKGISSDDRAGNENGSTNILCIDNMIQSPDRTPVYLNASTARRNGLNHRGLGPLNSLTKFYGLLSFLDPLLNPE